MFKKGKGTYRVKREVFVCFFEIQTKEEFEKLQVEVEVEEEDTIRYIKNMF